MATWRGRPSRRERRARFGTDPAPGVAIIEPAFVVRDVFALVQQIGVLGDRYRFSVRHDDRARHGGRRNRGGNRDRDRRHDRARDCGRNRDDLSRGHRLGGNDNDRNRTRINDCAHQVHDVGRKPDAVVRSRDRFVRIPCENSRSKDDRSSERRADNKCFVESLLDRISYFRKVRVLCFYGLSICLDCLILLYIEFFDCQMDFKTFFRFFRKKRNTSLDKVIILGIPASENPAIQSGRNTSPRGTAAIAGRPGIGLGSRKCESGTNGPDCMSRGKTGIRPAGAYERLAPQPPSSHLRTCGSSASVGSARPRGSHPHTCVRAVPRDLSMIRVAKHKKTPSFTMCEKW